MGSGESKIQLSKDVRTMGDRWTLRPTWCHLCLHTYISAIVSAPFSAERSHIYFKKQSTGSSEWVSNLKRGSPVMR